MLIRTLDSGVKWSQALESEGHHSGFRNGHQELPEPSGSIKDIKLLVQKQPQQPEDEGVAHLCEKLMIWWEQIAKLVTG